MRRRMIEKKGEKYPFYSDYPTITEYGTFYFQPQTEDNTLTNLFLKLDDTHYNWCGSARKNQQLYIEYTEERIIIRQNFEGSIWIQKEQKSSRFSLKRCSGTENNPALVIFKIDKVS